LDGSIRQIEERQRRIRGFRGFLLGRLVLALLLLLDRLGLGRHTINLLDTAELREPAEDKNSPPTLCEKNQGPGRRPWGTFGRVGTPPEKGPAQLPRFAAAAVLCRSPLSSD